MCINHEQRQGCKPHLAGIYRAENGTLSQRVVGDVPPSSRFREVHAPRASRLRETSGVGGAPGGSWAISLNLRIACPMFMPSVDPHDASL